MKSKVVEDADIVTYVVVCDPGDEAVSALTQFARSEDLEAAQITAVGALSTPPSAGSTARPRTTAVSRWRSSASCSR